jgi:hypothetical protein
MPTLDPKSRRDPAPFDAEDEPTEVDLLAQAPMGALVGDATPGDAGASASQTGPLASASASASDEAALIEAGKPSFRGSWPLLATAWAACVLLLGRLAPFVVTLLR